MFTLDGGTVEHDTFDRSLQISFQKTLKPKKKKKSGVIDLVKANSFHEKAREAEIMAVEFECGNWALFLVIHAGVKNC